MPFKLGAPRSEQNLTAYCEDNPDYMTSFGRFWQMADGRGFGCTSWGGDVGVGPTQEGAEQRCANCGVQQTLEDCLQDFTFEECTGVTTLEEWFGSGNGVPNCFEEDDQLWLNHWDVGKTQAELDENRAQCPGSCDPKCHCSPGCNKFRMVGNGICDFALCMNEACDWDGGDCALPSMGIVDHSA